ncbi:abortive infection AbiH-like protein [Kordia periserrulae]|uniref:Abortive infection AbiH-like protein n=1 Tax=Kordia periserrulae TaxID=701523 RepID=A0A2T6C6Q0_9FLAO|nr:AbiH family protein [Kordia periserrulae]PTX64001.1 abortive infection AbiH-like protein [Kordia periserrulae]
MNKLIIAGNGFDLAHGLPTSYNHFMDAFWRDLKYSTEDQLIQKLIHLESDYGEFLSEKSILNFKSFKEALKKYIHNNERYFHGISIKNYTICIANNKPPYDIISIQIFKFKNDFFRELNETQSIQNWVDVENEYYQSLKNICKNGVLKARQKRANIVKLHQEFEQVKKLFIRYLKKNVIDEYKIESDYHDGKLLEIFQHYSRYDSKLKISKEFSDVNDFHQVNEMVMGSNEFLMRSLIVTYVLNFNYTNTFEKYKKLMKKNNIILHVNHIHGELNNNLVFGFGDEMDEDYKLIEDMDDNEYLRYFKSFQYSQNSNYKDVLRYIDSEKFQVIIMGHSCGLSDRVLLNTIFEHDNCRSIKVFYHQKEDGTDNYTETIQNISRHFKDKQLMRTKIVEKTLCEPMPQLQLPKKK